MTNTNNNKIGISKNGIPFALNLKYLNRHGYIGGATGSGKTTTLKKIVEVLHDNNINTFMIDVKKDLQAIGNHESIDLIDFYGLNGRKVDISINDLGIDHLSNVIALTEPQKEVLKICLLYTQKQGYTIENTIELYDSLDHILYLIESENEDFQNYGYISKASLKTILRKLKVMELEKTNQAFDVTTFNPLEIVNNPITIMDASELLKTPRLYSAIINYMLRTLLTELPEVGDLNKPKAILLLDEAHLIFNHASKRIISDLIETIKLLRSKGIGVIFISQLMNDIPKEIYSQLTFKIQHAINISTEDDFRKLKSLARSFSEPNKNKETEDIIQNLSIGQALIVQKDMNGSNERAVIKVEPSKTYITSVIEPENKSIHITPIKPKQSSTKKNTINGATVEPNTTDQTYTPISKKPMSFGGFMLFMLLLSFFVYLFI